MKTKSLSCVFLVILFVALAAPVHAQRRVRRTVRSRANSASVYPMHEGFVDAHGVMIYYMTVGRGAPLMIVHGGPGASHDYFCLTCCRSRDTTSWFSLTSAARASRSNFPILPSTPLKTWWRM